MIPEQFKDRMREYLGEREYEDFISSFDNEKRYHALRINTLKTDKEDMRNKLMFLTESVPWEEDGFYYEDGEPGKLPYHEAGLYYIQEPSAMAPVHFLEPVPGEKVLDLCAAPGGKTTQIAAALRGEGILVANEINRDRAKVLSLNVERLGIKNALVLNETPEHLSDIFEGCFDKILVDAPCSGEGMFRKNEIAAAEWSMENVKLCANRQEQILDDAAKMLLPGGRLVYSTCTFSADENEETIFKFLLKHSDFHAKKVSLTDGIENGRVELISKELIESAMKSQADENLSEADFTLRQIDALIDEVSCSIRLWPHKLKGEGHFLCVLERDGKLIKENDMRYVPGGGNVTAKPETIKPFEYFISETLVYDRSSFEIKQGKIRCMLKSGRTLEGKLIMFGEQLYLIPEKMPGIEGLKVMRAGLHLGTVKKDRFEPSHALALYLKAEDCILKHDFPASGDEIKSYLNGQTLRINTSESLPDGDNHGKGKNKDKGWTLILTDSCSIGWAKNAGGMLKNHYPKGLRINY